MIHACTARFSAESKARLWRSYLSPDSSIAGHPAAASFQRRRHSAKWHSLPTLRSCQHFAALGPGCLLVVFGKHASLVPNGGRKENHSASDWQRRYRMPGRSSGENLRQNACLSPLPESSVLRTPGFPERAGVRASRPRGPCLRRPGL